MAVSLALEGFFSCKLRLPVTKPEQSAKVSHIGVAIRQRAVLQNTFTVRSVMTWPPFL